MEAAETPKRRRRSPNLKREIERRAQSAVKLAELESHKVAVGEMVLERLDEIVALLHSAGFKVSRPAAQAAQPNPQVSQPIVAAAQPVKNPCALCGREASHAQDLEGGKKQFLCRAHADEYIKENAGGDIAAKLMGSTGTMFERPKSTRPPPPKTVIQAEPVGPDLLKGDFTNGSAAPPANSVLGDS